MSTTISISRPTLNSIAERLAAIERDISSTRVPVLDSLLTPSALAGQLDVTERTVLRVLPCVRAQDIVDCTAGAKTSGDVLKSEMTNPFRSNVPLSGLRRTMGLGLFFQSPAAILSIRRTV